MKGDKEKWLTENEAFLGSPYQSSKNSEHDVGGLGFFGLKRASSFLLNGIVSHDIKKDETKHEIKTYFNVHLRVPIKVLNA